MFTVSPQTDMFRGALGGTILGLSATGLMLLNGHITGVSGIFNKFIADEHRGWRAWYVAGLGSAGLALRLLLGSETTLGPSGGDSGLKPAAAIVAGALVGLFLGCFAGTLADILADVDSVRQSKGRIRNGAERRLHHRTRCLRIGKAVS